VRAAGGAEVKIEPNTVLRGSLHTTTDLSSAEREFLLSLKRLEPKRELLGLPGLERLPGPQWKLYNLRKMDSAKRKTAKELLRRKLGL
jgi:hypothetical protein